MILIENDNTLKQLIKWFIKLTVNIFDSNKSSHSKKITPESACSVSFETVFYIIILNILRSNRAISNIELFKKQKEELTSPEKLFKKHTKTLKHFGYTASGQEYIFSTAIINGIDSILASSAQLSPVILNQFYEQILSIKFTSKNKKLVFSFDNSHKKKNGIFYTPQVLARVTVNKALNNFIGGQNKSGFSCKILDPSCGCGIFLYECYDQILKSSLFAVSKKTKNIEQISLFSQSNPVIVNSLKDKQELLLKSFYGIDSDPQAVRITKAMLLLRMLQDEKDTALTAKVTKALNKNFACGSFYEEPAEKISSKRKKIPEIKDDVSKITSKNFDIIIGNPPWVTYRKSEIGNKRWDFLRQRYKSVSLFKMNTFPIFVEHSIELMKKNSIVCFITPQRILDTPSYSELRKILTEDRLINRIENLSDKFSDEIVADSVILYLSRIKSEKFIISHLGSNFEHASEEEISYSELKEPEFKINIHSQNIHQPILDKIAFSSHSLNRYFNIHVGVMIKNKKLQYTSPEKGAPLITSKCFSKFSPVDPKFVNLKKELIFGGTKDSAKQTTCPKIIVRKTGKEIVSTIDFHGIFTEQSCYLLLPKNNYDLLFICALLNSKLVKFFFLNNLVTNLSSYPYIQHYDLEKIPVFKFEYSKDKSRQIAAIKSLSSKIFSLGNKFTGDSNNKKQSRQFAKLIEKADSVIYSLYDLDEKEIASIEEFLSK